MILPIHVMHVVGNLGVGGAETGVLRLIQGLSGPEFQHSITLAGSDRSLIEATGIDVPCYSLGIRGRCYSAFLRMAKIFKSRKVNVVHVNNLPLWLDALLASRLCGCPCVETFHGIEDPNLALSILKRSLYRVAGLLSARVTAVSDEAAQLLSVLTGMNPKLINLIPNGVDTSRFVPPKSTEQKRALRQQKGLPVDAFLIGCVAALRPVKNHRGLLDAFQRATRDSKSWTFLVLVGDGPLDPDLRNLARELGIEDRVIFLGKRTDVDDLLRCFDLFVLNSYTEGLSYAMLEAMASGLPVVATAVGAAVRLVHEEQEGFLVPAGNTDALAKVIKKILQKPESLQRMGVQARKKVQSEYAIERMLERYRFLYEEIVLGA